MAQAGVDLDSAPNDKDTAGTIHVTQNFIHNNVQCGAGYGVVVHGQSYTLIDRNVFDYDRHDVAGDGSTKPHGYVADLNFILTPGPTCDGNYNQHFDMHGSCCTPHWNGGTAGEFMDIFDNTIRGAQTYGRHNTRPAFELRGTPSDKAVFALNTVTQSNENEAVNVVGVCGLFCDDKGTLKQEHKLLIQGNKYNFTTANDLAVGHFAADGCSDVFQANGTAWWYSPCGQGAWRFLKSSNLLLNQLALGDFNGDGTTDVFTQAGGKWTFYYGGSSASPLTVAAGSNIPMKDYRFGNFDDNVNTDIFRIDGLAVVLLEWRYVGLDAAAVIEPQDRPAALR